MLQNETMGYRRSLKYLAAVLVATLAIAFLGLVWVFVGGGQTGVVAKVTHNSAYLALVCAFAALAIYLWSRRGYWRIAAVPVSIAFCVILTLDLSFFNYFHAPFHLVYRYLPIAPDVVTLQTLHRIGDDYFSLELSIMGALASVGLAAILFFGRQTIGMTFLVLLLLVPVLSLGTHFHRQISYQTGIQALTNTSPLKTSALKAVDRGTALSVQSPALFRPETILLVIMESTGSNLTSSDGRMLLQEKLAELGGGQDWILFDNAVTNSNATDIAIPSILTGVGGQEGIVKLHSMPFLFNLASAAGYSTAFVTSSTLLWASFNEFFSTAPIDTLVSAESLGKPFANDLAMDDYFAFEATLEVLKTDDPLFLTLYTMGMHRPLLADSLLGVPKGPNNRLTRAIHIQEKGLARVFDAMHSENRFDDALIIIIGDHGEHYSDKTTSVSQDSKPRLHSFKRGVLSPIFLIKLPNDFPEPSRIAIEGNQSQLVSGLDIAPTVAELLGIRATGGLNYAGNSLLQPIADDRVTMSVATSEWRSWFLSALAVSRGSQRLLCEAEFFCQLYRQVPSGLVPDHSTQIEFELIAEAMRDLTIRRIMGRIYRDHLALGGGEDVLVPTGSTFPVAQGEG